MCTIYTQKNKFKEYLMLFYFLATFLFNFLHKQVSSGISQILGKHMYKDGRTSPLGIKTVAAVELHLWQVNTQGLIMNFLYKTGEKKHETFEFVADAYIV